VRERARLIRKRARLVRERTRLVRKGTRLIRERTRLDRKGQRLVREEINDLKIGGIIVNFRLILCSITQCKIYFYFTVYR
jgi:hypothetical protein